MCLPPWMLEPRNAHQQGFYAIDYALMGSAIELPPQEGLFEDFRLPLVLAVLLKSVATAPPGQPHMLPALSSSASSTAGGSISCEETSGVMHCLYFC